MEFKDYYKTLELTPEASQDDIRKAYRKLARKYHPDVSKEKDAETRMREVNEANDVLRDEEKRAAYDQLRTNVSSGGAAPGPGWDRGFEFAGGDGHAPNDAEFHDFLSSLFKQAERQRRGPGVDSRQAGAQQAYKGEDHHADIEISLEDSLNGVTRELGLRSVQLDAQGHPQLVNRTLSVKIPVGVRAGQMIRLSGQGMPGEAGGPAGDLFLTVHFAAHPVYQVQGRDLTMKLPVAPWEAACGGQVRVPTLQGEVEVSIGAGSQPGSKLRLRGKGLPGDPAGDLYLVLDVVWPPATTEAAKEAYQALAKAAPFNPRRHLGGTGMKSVTIYSAVLVDGGAPLSLQEMAYLCEQHVDWVVSLVREGLVGIERDALPSETSPDLWVFASAAAARARQIARAQRDFDVNLDAAALMVDLMEEVRQLRAQLEVYQR